MRHACLDWFCLGLALGWLFSSSVFVSNSVKVVSNAFDFGNVDREEERTVSGDSERSDRARAESSMDSSILVRPMPTGNTR